MRSRGLRLVDFQNFSVTFFCGLIFPYFLIPALACAQSDTTKKQDSVQREDEPKSVAGATDNLKIPYQVPQDTSKLPAYALVVTTKGPFEVKLFRTRTPASVANFEYLGKQGFYEGLTFHRYVKNFVIQGGDPLGTGKGGPGWRMLPEIHPDIHHVVGTIGWARKTAGRNPQRLSSGSQFYICLSPQPRLDGFYSAFGVVVKGMENVLRLRKGDKILKVRFPVAHTTGW